MELAQGIGIRYVWIGSLCIIQGDSEDWQSEAANTGSVYGIAALVVAASGAKNSEEGLFITDRPPVLVYQSPYWTAGVRKGTFNLIQSPHFLDWHPACGPLEERAWTLQERVLAPRLMTFIPYGIAWICKSASVGEAGSYVHTFGQEEWWPQLLHEYTPRSLSFPSGRLEALKGMADGVQRS